MTYFLNDTTCQALELLRFELNHADEFDAGAAARGEHPLRHTELHAE